MSNAALQRVVVRMLHDPDLVAAVYRNPDAALAGADLTAQERRWLTARDPRAYATDPHRRGRTLTALIEELPVAAALLVRAAGEAALDAFPSSEAFHAAIQGRGSLAAAFAAWLAEQPVREHRLAPIARLEGAVARVRRATPAPPPVGLVTAPTVAALRLPGGTLAFHTEAAAVLATHRSGPVAAVLDRSVRLPDRRLADAPEELLVERAPDGTVAMSVGSEALGDVLRACASPTPRAAALEAVRAHGVEPGEDEEVLDGLLADGLLLTA